MAVTLHDVAQLAGVSIKTVSNVINDYPHISIATREKVEAAVAQLGYQPNLSARGLRSGRTGVIGLALPELSLSYFGELADAVIARAHEHGLAVQIEQTGADRDREVELLRSPRIRLTEGIIFSPLGMGPDDAQLLDVEYPLVLLGERIFGAPVDHVTMQNVEAARAATEYLIAHGRRRIAVLGAHAGEVVGSAGLRLRGYREALQQAGLPFDPELIAHTTLWHRANGASCMRELLGKGVEFDAVFGLNDTLALGGMRVLQEAGYRVPEEVAVIGFDNLDEAQYSLPSLTTIDPGREQIARLAVDTLIARIDERERPRAEPRETLVDFSLVERESTVPMASV